MMLSPKAFHPIGRARGTARAAVALMCSAAIPPCSPQLQAALQYLQQHPPQLKSVPMLYDKHAEVPIPEVAAKLSLEHISPNPSHMAHVLLALMHVAFGALDKAHNLVTPLSWGGRTEYGGEPIPKSPAAKEAAYVHALVHRWEGAHEGEFGTGFSNANYWYRAAGPLEVLPALQAAALEAAGGDSRYEKYVAGPRLDTTRLVALCDEALRSKDPGLVADVSQLSEGPSPQPSACVPAVRHSACVQGVQAELLMLR
ncbi:hypothetical protein QJQ45_027413 [Haematococcus lacustris]|nr:hypothetical protein QJQ45_027413 [Haematococcus lacustris]